MRISFRRQGSWPAAAARHRAPSPGRHHRPRSSRRRWIRWAAVVLVAALVLLGGAAAWASQTPPPVPTAPVLVPEASLDQVLTNIRNWIMGILISLAVVFLTVGFVRLMTANGDPGEVGKAKDAFRNAGLGFGGAVLAPVVVEILRGIVAV